MARKVFVSGEMSSDDRLIDVDADCPEAVLLWPWFLTAFDDWGRAEANAKKLWAKVFPAVSVVDVNRVEEALLAFDKVGLIHLYEVGGKRYMSIDADKWFKWQTHIRKQKRTNDESKIPAPDASAQTRANARKCTPSPSPSLSSTTTNATPTGPDDPPNLKRVAEEYAKVSGVLVPSPNDQTAMFQALKVAAPEAIIAYMWEVRAKEPGKKLRAFSYFLPGLEDRAAKSAHRESAASRSPPVSTVLGAEATRAMMAAKLRAAEEADDATESKPASPERRG